MIYAGETVEGTQGRIMCDRVEDGKAILVDAVTGETFEEEASEVFTDQTPAQIQAAYELYGPDGS